MFYAHSTDDATRGSWQPLDVHLRDVGALAREFATAFGAGPAGQLAGLLHDLGKYNPAFQKYIAGKSQSVDHSTAGAAILLFEARAMQKRGQADWLMLELLAHGIAGHHAGLPDRISTDGRGGSLKARVDAFDEAVLDSCWQDELKPGMSNLSPPLNIDTRNAQAKVFQLAFLGRMVFSCLVDADFKDTEAFYAQAESRKVDRAWVPLKDILGPLIERFDDHMAGLQQRSVSSASPVGDLRHTILDHVRGKASLEPGVFTLNVPTGGGKTLASLGFALDHAQRYGKRRIIYAIPFTSIIDQTATIFREVLGDDVILEHHSAIEEERVQSREQADKLKLAMEDWAAPIVVTTNVQLFESLFASRPSRCRKLHNIAQSVIILDEAQTLPLPLLKPAVMALGELARNYGCSIVLCTATQPALDQSHYPPASLMGLETAGRELAPDPAELAKRFRRACILWTGEMSDADLVAALGPAEQALVIVNTRAHALDLFRACEAAGLSGMIHLTTRQCAAHRAGILVDIRQRLKDKRPCRVIATSLIEAGVDVDFPKVWRAEAGLESILQAAGRCNREGRRPLEDSIVSVFTPSQHEAPREVAQLAAAFRRVADRFDDLFAPEAIRAYFDEVYWQKGDQLDAHGILGLAALDRSGTQIAYRTMAEKFRMIDTPQVPVIIPFNDHGREWVAKLDVEGVPSGLIARKLQRHVVQVPARARAELLAAGQVKFRATKQRGEQFAVLETEALYQLAYGLEWEAAGTLSHFMI